MKSYFAKAFLGLCAWNFYRSISAGRLRRSWLTLKEVCIKH